MAATNDKSILTEAEVTNLTSISDFVKAGIDSIVKSAPKSSLFVPDSVQVTAIDDLLNKAPTLAANIEKDLKYSAKADVEAVLVKDLHTQLADLDKIFTELDRATAAEIQMIAVGLSAVSAPTPPDPTDKKAVNVASDNETKKAFGNVAAIEFQLQLANQDFNEALQKFEKKEEKF